MKDLIKSKTWNLGAIIAQGVMVCLLEWIDPKPLLLPFGRFARIQMFRHTVKTWIGKLIVYILA